MKTLFILISVIIAAAIPASVVASDIEPPVLVDFDFNPKTVDVSVNSASVTVEISATDDVAGLNNLFAEFRSPSGLNGVMAQGASLISGTIQNGVWSLETQLITPLYEPGEWIVEQVWITDHAGRTSRYYTAALQAMGFPTQLTVIGETPISVEPTTWGRIKSRYSN